MRVLTAAIISADPDLRKVVRESRSVDVTLEITVPVPDVGTEELDDLESLRPDFILIELEEEPELALQLVQYLAQAAPGRPVLVAGPTPSTELLLNTMRAGAAEYLQKELAPETIDEVVERLAQRMGHSAAAESQPLGRICTFVGAKGGIGTTMIATNVAVELRRLSGAEVLVADFRFGLGDAAVHLGITPRFHLVDLIDNLHRIDPRLLSSFVETHESGVQLLASPAEAEKIDTVQPPQVREVLRFLRTQYAFTIVDAPDPYAPHARAIFAESDWILLVATPEVTALRNVTRVRPLLEHGGAARSAEVTLVVNRFVPSRSVPAEEIQRMIGMPVQRTITNDYETVTRSVSEGKPLIDSKTAVAKDLARLAQDLHGHAGGAGSPTRKAGSGLLSSLVGWARRTRGEGPARGGGTSPQDAQRDR